MADMAANYLRRNPEKAMIVLAGGEHILYGSGIPNRMKSRIPGLDGTALLVDADDDERNRGAADYFLATAKLNLPAAGRMGVVFDSGRHGVIAKQITPGSAAAQAGIKPKDCIVSIDGQPIHTVADARLALLDKAPGQPVSVEIERGRWMAKKSHHLSLVLKG